MSSLSQVRSHSGVVLFDTAPEVVVENIEFGIGNMSIDKNKAVLSGHGIASQFLQDNVLTSSKTDNYGTSN